MPGVHYDSPMEPNKKELQPWKVLKTQDVFVAEPWLKLSVQQVALPDGRIVDDYYQIALQEHAVIVAQTVDGRVIMEQQYKHGLRDISLVLPGERSSLAKSRWQQQNVNCWKKQVTPQKAGKA